MKKIFFFLLLSTAIICRAQNGINIIPQPVEIMQPQTAGSFSITATTIIVLEGSGLENAANFFNDYLQHFYNLKLKIAKKATGSNAIVLNY